ncbi:MAG: hypothetical protein COB04_12385 [Gammaproteobacteria bacterium]|nr:MAG: hypothetical protein COB04_12385 [Gammaproteobacteria bacterium]
MPQYSNAKLPEHINVSKVSPLKDFISLTGGLLAIAFVLAFTLAIVGNWLAPKIPYEWEQRLGDVVESTLLDDFNLNSEHPQRAYLQALVDQLWKLQLTHESSVNTGPNTITVHYVESDIANAFATLGGQIIVTSALLDKITHETGLYFILAHEVAHIKYRHPIQAIGRGVLFSLVLSAFTGSQGDDLLDHLTWNTGSLTLLRFNRHQEQQSDIEALRTLYQHYGHTEGAFEFFEYLVAEEQKADQNENQVPVFLSTHPDTQARIVKLKEIAQEQRWQPMPGKSITLQPLPKFE